MLDFTLHSRNRQHLPQNFTITKTLAHPVSFTFCGPLNEDLLPCLLIQLDVNKGQNQNLTITDHHILETKEIISAWHKTLPKIWRNFLYDSLQFATYCANPGSFYLLVAIAGASRVSCNATPMPPLCSVTERWIT